MTGIATSPSDILRFLIGCKVEGRSAVLVTLVGIEGSSPRAIGTQMAVASNGDYVGSLSGGCIEAAVAAEAIAALESGVPRIIRYGRGSPYLDIRLPCGGGIDLLFTPNPEPSALEAVLRLLDARKAARLTLGNAIAVHEATGPSAWNGEDFTVTYTPALRIIAFGQGEELTATARLAHGFGSEIEVYSPHERDISLLNDNGIVATLLEFRGAVPHLRSDPWTAMLFLFHDREWEEVLLPWALGLPRLYVGALGSRASHAPRIAMLEAAGLTSSQMRSLRSPVGLIGSTREPATLALSILAEIAEAYMLDAFLSLGKMEILAKTR